MHTPHRDILFYLWKPIQTTIKLETLNIKLNSARIILYPGGNCAVQFQICSLLLHDASRITLPTPTKKVEYTTG